VLLHRAAERVLRCRRGLWAAGRRHALRVLLQGAPTLPLNPLLGRQHGNICSTTICTFAGRAECCALSPAKSARDGEGTQHMLPRCIWCAAWAYLWLADERPWCLIYMVWLASGGAGVPAADGAAAGHPALPRLVVGAPGAGLLGELPPLRPLEAQGELECRPDDRALPQQVICYAWKDSAANSS